MAAGSPSSLASRLRNAAARVPVVGPLAVAGGRAVRRRIRPRRVRLVEGYPARFAIHPPAPPVPAAWPTPVQIDDPFAVIDGAVLEAASDVVFDVDLFEALNAEYAARPLVAAPQQYDAASLETRAAARLGEVHRAIDLSSRRVLEFGCGAGYEIWTVAHQFDADGWGVDLHERRAWGVLADERTHFVAADIATDRPFQADFFDRVISFTVFEHVEHPQASLAELCRIMKPGGLAWIKANLYRGPMASHRYRWVHFPYPHLLFTDEVFEEYCRRHDLPVLGAAWVNRLSWADYERAIREAGLRIRMLRFVERPLDEAFYERFEGVLGRYPRRDLTRDFFEVVLEKPARRSLARRLSARR